MDDKEESGMHIDGAGYGGGRLENCKEGATQGGWSKEWRRVNKA